MPACRQSVVHALPANAHGVHEIIRGSRCKTLSRKKGYGLPKRLVLIEFFRSSHAPTADGQARA
jgi:hypothetical protein